MFKLNSNFDLFFALLTDATKASAKRDSNAKSTKEPKKARKDAEAKAPATEANADIVGSGRQAAQVGLIF
jgi:23S rRNA maturation mini-RNase III